jgi:hypothetical protein
MMTDYELVSTLNETLSILWLIFSTYVSIVFAFLVASYLVANKLMPKIVPLLLFIYSLVAFWAISGLYRTGLGVIGIVGEIKRGVLESTSSLSWHSSMSMSDSLLDYMPVIVTSIPTLAFIGSILFFFHQRKIS